MEIVTLDEFIAEVETTFRNYADTNDIDRVSIKTWVIGALRKFGKNICDTKEKIVSIDNSRAVLPEDFKSLIVALKLDENQLLGKQPEQERKLIVEKQRIENPAEWTTTTRDYFVNYCESKIVTEKIYVYGQLQDKYYTPTFLSLVKGIKRESLDTNCLNLHPKIRENYPNKISVTNRTLNTNFKQGKIYIQYNSLPSDENGEIAIPIISTGHIYEYILNSVKIKLAEDFIVNQKNPQGISQLISTWMQMDRLYFIQAKSEANYNGLTEGFDRRMYNKNRLAQKRYDIKF